ncbi:hypothetical protein AVEN_136713-1 [Araneus ventricosus]|uniref:HAT C-terminal dimerisation domain-containing protein n=1 Tax=Araneus ventricosus TaxID=182803 RepID=A0A4Y2SIC4_ARAVE|nr:hypothetical protein AVEN_136713-1 [Araneus ventricosus]
MKSSLVKHCIPKTRKSDSLKDKGPKLFNYNKSFNLNKIVKQELQLFDSTENRSANIIKLGEALKIIPPTSSEAERTFSAAGLFITKLRTRLSDKSIDCLCFLKSYFKKE